MEAVWAAVREWYIASPKDPSATAIRKCRLEFLRAAVKHPEIRLGDTLREKVFKLSEQEWTRLGLPPVTRMEEWRPEQHEALLPSFFAERNRLIKEWAAGHNLPYDWVDAEAEKTFLPGMFPASLFTGVPAYGAPVFIWPPWPEGQHKKVYRKHLNASFQKQSGRFIRGVELERSRFLNHRFSQESHYSWAAEHVCLKRRFSRIANDAKPARTEQAISKAVLKILERIDIPSNYNLQRAKKSTA